MIRKLRRRHRLAWAMLLPIVATLLAISLLSRPEPPLMEEVPAPRDDQAETAATPENPPAQDEGR